MIAAKSFHLCLLREIFSASGSQKKAMSGRAKQSNLEAFRRTGNARERGPAANKSTASTDRSGSDVDEIDHLPRVSVRFSIAKTRGYSVGAAANEKSSVLANGSVGQRKLHNGLRIADTLRRRQLSIGMTPKKVHEVERFASVGASIAAACGTSVVVEAADSLLG